MVQFWKKLIRRAQSGIDTMTLIWHQRPYLEDQNWALLALSKYVGVFVLKNREQIMSDVVACQFSYSSFLILTLKSIASFKARIR